jgi:hypothetical protein
VQPTATAKIVYRANVHGFSSSADFATFIGSLIAQHRQTKIESTLAMD